MRRALWLFFLVLALGWLHLAHAQTPSATVVWTPNPAYEDDKPIVGSITYHVMKRSLGAPDFVEVLKLATNQHSPIARTIAGIVAGDCVHIIAEVAGERSAPSVEACLGVPPPPPPADSKIPKAVTTVTVTAVQP